VTTEASPVADPGIIFTALTAVALAGVALTGGRGSLPRVLVGALILATISNALTIKGIQPYWGTVVTGLLLMVSLGVEKAVAASVERRLVAAAQASVHSGKR
jgi:ribose/xylose/arabinose/galactoside ABC-type transport system permease subunit